MPSVTAQSARLPGLLASGGVPPPGSHGATNIDATVRLVPGYEADPRLTA